MRQISKNYLKNIGGVECLICGMKLKYISNTHLKKHHLSNKEYKKQFPFTPTMSKETLEKISNNGKKHKSQFMKVRTTNQNLSSIRNGQLISLAWKMGILKRTLESKIKQSNTLKKMAKNGTWKSPSLSLEARKKISLRQKERWKNGLNKRDKSSGRFLGDSR